MDSVQITEYEYYVYSSRDRSPVKAVVLFYGDGEYLGSAFFSTADEPLQQADKSPEAIYSLYYRYADLQAIIDMLRNESPVYLIYNGPINSLISTRAEPVGEGEG